MTYGENVVLSNPIGKRGSKPLRRLRDELGAIEHWRWLVSAATLPPSQATHNTRAIAHPERKP